MRSRILLEIGAFTGTVASLIVALLVSGNLLLGVEKRSISRDDHIYEGWPTIAKTRSGTLVLVYRESMGHTPFPFSRLAVRRSLDGGSNWSDRKILLETIERAEAVDKARAWLAPDALAGYEETLGRIKEPWQKGVSINCSRLITLADGSLFLVADIRRIAVGGDTRWVYKMWRSTDDGLTWSAPVDLPLDREGIVPQLTQLRDGRILLGLQVPVNEEQLKYLQGVTFSSDNGKTWSKTVFLPGTEGSVELVETGFVELDNGTLVGFGRNVALEKQQRPSVGMKVISKDGGRTWKGPFETWMLGLEGRPKVGLLASGEVCVTYRFDSPNEMLAMHVMTQAAAELETTAAIIPRQPIPEDIPAQIALQKGEKRPWYMTSYYAGRTVVLDIDRSVHRDGGYSDWVQLPSGDIFVVDYINGDAPLAQIRGYLVRRSDYILFPDGDMPWLHPSGQPFREITEGMARRQYEKNQAQTSKR